MIYGREIIDQKSQIIDPKGLGPRRFGSRLFVEEKDVCLHALRVKDPGGQPQERVDITFL